MSTEAPDGLDLAADGGDHRVGQRLALGVREAAALGGERARVGHAVADHAAADDADIRRGLVVEPAEGERRDGPRGGLDGVDPLLGLHAGVRGLALHGDVDGEVGRPAGDDGVERVVVEQEAARRGEAREVELLHAEQADLLLARDGNLDRRVHGRDAQRLEHLGDAGLVVGAENGRAARADDAVREPRLDADAGLDGVAVAGEEDGRRGAAASPGGSR